MSAFSLMCHVSKNMSIATWWTTSKLNISVFFFLISTPQEKHFAAVVKVNFQVRDKMTNWITEFSFCQKWVKDYKTLEKKPIVINLRRYIRKIQCNNVYIIIPVLAHLTNSWHAMKLLCFCVSRYFGLVSHYSFETLFTCSS